jgi:hypothetical protein
MCHALPPAYGKNTRRTVACRVGVSDNRVFAAGFCIDTGYYADERIAAYSIGS